MYFSYHAKIKRLIAAGRLTHYEFVNDWHGIRPALVIYFDDARPMPVREYRWDEYTELIGQGPRASEPRECKMPGIGRNENA